jgi:hypothetical protein
MRQTSTAVISPLAAWLRMSTIWASVYLVCFSWISSLRGDTNTGGGTEIGGHPVRDSQFGGSRDVFGHRR